MAGPIAVGKTAVAQQLAADLGAEVVSVRRALVEVLGLSTTASRDTLQREGADLDRRTRGAWLVDYLIERTDRGVAPLVVDSLRTVLQTEPVLLNVANARLFYLAAHLVTRRRRYGIASATDPVKRSVPFDEAMNHPTEQRVVELRSLARLVIDTDDLTIREVADIVGDALTD
ncbi:hypothetical protein [Mycobacterium sp. 141]|uniref:hypothetical protein n=1 Tax=Mycobacterium sp. 141 TaxID=1120797 RepID=UPI00037F1D31|nr:hypothetical protein [Mycobacterium sp. 141]